MMKPGDRVHHKADKACGTVVRLEPYFPATGVADEIPGVRVLWDDARGEETVHPTANIKPCDGC
jgi:hypothetical protein